MKLVKIKKSTVLKVVALFVFAIAVTKITTSFGMQNYYKLDFSTGLVTASSLNVRSGPGTNYPIIARVYKNSYIRVFAGVGNWYIVQIEGDYVGAVSKDYVKAIYPSTGSTRGGSVQPSPTPSSGTSSGGYTTNNSNLTADELETFNLINQQRAQNGLPALKIDSEVQRVARIKAQDMVNNNYFSHTSPTYGSPFDMLKSFGISYKSAGENIAGNSSNSAAVTAWMNSSGHRANILNSSYNYTGVGVVTGSKYGKIYVQMFIGK